jgi:hypothetical protein
MLKYTLEFGYKVQDIDSYDRSYFEVIESKRWRAIEKRKHLIDGILEEVYRTLSSDRYKISTPKKSIIACGYYKGKYYCIDYYDQYTKQLRFYEPHKQKDLNFAYCLPFEELALYLYSKDINEDVRKIIKKRLEREIEIEIVRDDDLIYNYIKAKTLLFRQNRYITSYNNILLSFIKRNIELSSMRWYDPMTSQEPIVTLSFSDRTYLYHAGKFIYTPEEYMYMINREKDQWKLEKKNKEII